MQSLSASHRLSLDKKTQQASDLFFVSLFLVLFISDNSFIMTQPNARFLVEWPPLIRPLTATSSSPGSKNQVLKRRWNEKGRKRHRKLGNGATEEKKRIRGIYIMLLLGFYIETRRVERDTEIWGMGQLKKRKE